MTGTTEITTFAGTGGTATFGTNLGVLGLIFNTAGYTPDLCANTLLDENEIDASTLTSGTTTISRAIGE